MLRTTQRRNRQTDRPTDRQTDRQTDRHTYLQTTGENDNDKVSKNFNEDIGIETTCYILGNKELFIRYFEPSPEDEALIVW